MNVRLAIGSAALVAMIAAGTQTVRGNQIALEGFLTTFPAFNTGVGFTGAWAQGGFNVFSANYFTSPQSLVYYGLPHSGGSVVSPANNQINGAIRSLAGTLGADNTTAYVSFLLQPQGTLNGGIFEGFFGLTVRGNAGELFIGKPGAGDEGQFVLEDRGGFGQVPSGTSAVVGRTAFLVVKAEFLPGNDVFTLFVNPAPGGGEPVTGTVKSDLNVGAVSALGIYSTGAFAIDEIRVGSSFADVAPSPGFAGVPGTANCHAASVSALAGGSGLANAASGLGYPAVSDLQAAITAFCHN